MRAVLVEIGRTIGLSVRLAILVGLTGLDCVAS